MLTETYGTMFKTFGDNALQIARGNVALIETLTKPMQATPAAPVVGAVIRGHHMILEGFEALLESAQPGSLTEKPKKAIRKATKAAKKVVDAQADLMAETSATAVASQAELAEVTEKVIDDVASGDAVKLYDDLTVINGIGPSTMRKLQDAGIRSLEDLSKIGRAQLAEVLENANVRLMRFKPEDFIAEAKKLLKAAA